MKIKNITTGILHDVSRPVQISEQGGLVVLTLAEEGIFKIVTNNAGVTIIDVTAEYEIIAEARLNFGKYRGKTISYIMEVEKDYSYVVWLEEVADTEVDIEESVYRLAKNKLQAEASFADKY